MRLLPVLAIALSVLLFPLVNAPTAAHADNCTFVLGFAAIQSLIPGEVGQCLVDEHHSATNGDGLQETTGPSGAGGLLVWRKADNWTAYTDGYHTWVNGPMGLWERLNTQCFSWEGGCTNPISGSSSSPTSSSSSTPTTVSFTGVTGAAPGGTATVTVQTAPSAFCRVDFFGPHGLDRYAQGALAPKTADGNGVVSWTWTINPAIPPGNGTVTVMCNHVTATTSIAIGSLPTSFVSVTGAAPGGTASATVQTGAGALCRIDYLGPKGVDRFENGALQPQKAGSNGQASWSWTINQNTPAGTGTVNVTCDGVKISSPITIS
jgi:hypothetical protein